MLDKLAKKVDRWLAYRNEVIHSSMHKNVSILYEKLSERVEKGMECTRLIDAQARISKEKDKVRKVLMIQNT